jgi:phenylpropionate dioxygenase-like ring-hydroxylating dioxygenase large terminal subunit
MDLGHCGYTHPEILKEAYQQEIAKNGPGEYDYEFQLMRQLQSIVDDCDRRIARADKRIEQHQAPQEDQEVRHVPRAMVSPG